MPLFLLSLWGKTKLYVIGAVVGLIALFSFIKYEQHIGAEHVRQDDNEDIEKAVNEKRTIERRVNNSGISVDDERRVVREQRDKLQKLLRSR